MQDNKNKRIVKGPDFRSEPKERKPKKEKKIIQPVFTSKMGEDDETSHIPPLKDGDIRIIHMGGVEEVGRNMSMIEYKDTIIVIDCGIQFNESHTPGVDMILPNTKYIEERKHKIKAMFITHGHLDHIGAIPYIMPRIGNPQIYTRKFTSLMIRKRQDEFPYLPALRLNIIEKEDNIKIGDDGLEIIPFGVSHAIPDSMGIIIKTPYGNIIHTGDLKLDHYNGVPSEREIKNFSIFKEENNLLLMTDSTNVENPGFSISDKVVFDNIESAIKNATGRLIVASFASQVERMIFMLTTAEKYGKKIIVDGRSMKNNLELLKLAEMVNLNPHTIIPIEDIDKYPQNKLMILVTGGQGEEFASLSRIAAKTHKFIRLNKYDTVLMSSSIIPGNEQAIQRLKDNLSKQGSHIVHYKTSDVHSSGHANYDELLWIHGKINSKFFIPVHGYHYLLDFHKDLAVFGNNMPEENIFIPDNGAVFEIRDQGKTMVRLEESAPNDILVVDGTSVGKIQDFVLRDRLSLGQDGVFGVIVIIDQRMHKLRKSPDIASRGFIYLKESQEILFNTRDMIKNITEDYLNKNYTVNIDELRMILQDSVYKYLLRETGKRPLVVPLVILV